MNFHFAGHVCIFHLHNVDSPAATPTLAIKSFNAMEVIALPGNTSKMISLFCDLFSSVEFRGKEKTKTISSRELKNRLQLLIYECLLYMTFTYRLKSQCWPTSCLLLYV